MDSEIPNTEMVIQLTAGKFAVLSYPKDMTFKDYEIMAKAIMAHFENRQFSDQLKIVK